MQRCELCQCSTMSTPEGYKCMNPHCEGSKVARPAAKHDDQACSECGEKMTYKGLNSWGEPNYVCAACGETAKL